MLDFFSGIKFLVYYIVSSPAGSLFSWSMTSPFTRVNNGIKTVPVGIIKLELAIHNSKNTRQIKVIPTCFLPVTFLPELHRT